MIPGGTDIHYGGALIRVLALENDERYRCVERGTEYKVLHKRRGPIRRRTLYLPRDLLERVYAREA